MSINKNESKDKKVHDYSEKELVPPSDLIIPMPNVKPPKESSNQSSTTKKSDDKEK